MRKLHLSLGMLSIAMVISCTKNIHEEPQATNEETDFAATSAKITQTPAGAIVSDEILVKFKSNTSDEKKSKALARIEGNISERILTKAMKHGGDNDGVYLIKTSVNALEAISKIKGLEIEFAEPNYVYTHDATSNDTYYTNGSLWGMYGDASSPANQYGSQAAEAWAAGNTGSSAVYIGVIDEGAMNDHTDLAANFWTNPFDPVGGGDQDGNGYADDTHGWDFAGNNNTTFDGTGDDHGTHVAGTIGAVGGNGIGVAGVNWDVTLISGKFLGAAGGTTANAIKAVDYFTDLKTRHGLNIVATSNSWGGGGYSQSLYDAIQRANNAGILFIAAAGNATNNNDASPSYPASYTNANIIAVASITSSGAISSFSSYGATSVDIGAPGSGVYSTVPGPAGKGKNRNVFASNYASYSGTSMATPHVSGAAALYASTHPGATAADIKAAILNSAIPTASLAGKCVTGGRLNVSGF